MRVVVPEEDEPLIPAAQHQVGTAVIVEVGKGDRLSGEITEPEARAHVGKTAVEVVAQKYRSSGPGEDQIQIPIVIHIDECDAPGIGIGADPWRSRSLQSPVAIVAQQGNRTALLEKEEVQPSIVVEIHELGIDYRGRQVGCGGGRHFLKEPRTGPVETWLWTARDAGDQELVAAVAVDVPGANDGRCRRGWSSSRLRQTSTGGGVHEGDAGRCLGLTQSAQGDEVLRGEGEHGTAEERPLHPAHIRQARLIRRRHLHGGVELFQRLRRGCGVAGAQRRGGALERRPGILGGLRRELPDVFQVPQGAVALPRRQVAFGEAEAHREIGGIASQDPPEKLQITHRISTRRRVLHFGQGIEDPHIVRHLFLELLQQRARLLGVACGGVGTGEDQRHLHARRVQASCLLQFPASFVQATGPEIGQPQIGATQRLIGRKLNQAREMRLRLRQLPPFQREEPFIAKGEQLLHRHFFLGTGGEKEGDEPERSHAGGGAREHLERSDGQEGLRADGETSGGQRGKVGGTEAGS